MRIIEFDVANLNYLWRISYFLLISKNAIFVV